jgi:hypothetical protein
LNLATFSGVRPSSGSFSLVLLANCSHSGIAR